jgi:transcriptional regulator with XRE-family HTH domain
LAEVQREIGRRIASARDAVGLSQEEAAARAGIDDKRWQKLEAGTVNPTVKTLYRVARTLGLDFLELLHGTSDRA